jgi:hypothetical protein
MSAIGGREKYDAIERQSTKAMEALAKTLPVWSWAETVRGFGAVSLATIVAEAGDLSTRT